MAFAICFSIPEKCGRLESKGAFSCVVRDGRMTASVFYQNRMLPLVLEATVHAGDNVKLVVLPHRLELWVNESLRDEEWAEKGCLSDEHMLLRGDFPAEIVPYAVETPDLPCVLGEFEDAEGWRPEWNVFVGDCMPYVCDGRYHVLYLKDRHHHTSKWGLGAHQWEHISTEDFKTWQVHPMAVPITEPEEGSICTGSWIRKDGIHYLYYTIRMEGNPLRRSISYDGYHFEKDANFSVQLSEKYNGGVRDPKVFLAEDGKYHMLVTCRLAAEDKGCLAHLTSSDLTHWREEENPIYVSEDGTEPECPDYIVFGKWQYLIYSLHGDAHYMYTDRLGGEWRYPKQPIIPCDSVPKGAVWGDEIIFTGFLRMHNYGGNMTFRTAKQAENGELLF